MTQTVKILVVDDEKLVRWSIAQALASMGHEVIEAADGTEALSLVNSDAPEVVLLDVRLPGLDGLEVLKTIRSKHPECAVVMISAHGTLDGAVEAMKLGAVDYIRKPFQAEDIKLLVTRLVEKLRLQEEVAIYRGREQRQYGLDTLVGVSEPILQVRELVAKIAASDATNILVEGESGTGKGLVAKVIHYVSSQLRKPFMEVSCTALAENLVESELFGHEKGAFTDAKTTKKGMFELANGGTIFLDEVGDMPPGAQAKLLRALEDRTFKRVGGVRDITVDVRVVAATNRDLEEEVSTGRFRKDLFYRLAVLRIPLAPLRSRPEDVPYLVEHFIEHFNREFRRRYRRASPEAVEILKDYHWPGNVRELRNVIERAMILDDKDEILPDDLPALSCAEKEGTVVELPPEGVSIQQVERDLIAKALQATRGNQTRAAKLLRISRDTLRYRMKKHGFIQETHSEAVG